MYHRFSKQQKRFTITTEINKSNLGFRITDTPNIPIENLHLGGEGAGPFE